MPKKKKENEESYHYGRDGGGLIGEHLDDSVLKILQNPNFRNLQQK